MADRPLGATAVAGANIAFVKYWGNQDDRLRIPMNSSISMTLDAAQTTTQVTFRANVAADRLILNDREAEAGATSRVSHHLDHIRNLAGTALKAEVISQNSFPTGAGIASSASGFAALTVAACAALDLELSNIELSRIARLGSGSACRSVDGGFVEWQAGQSHDDSYAVPLAPPEHWDLVDIIAIVSRAHKRVGSTMGHPLAHTSPFYRARLMTVPATLEQVRQAILRKDFHALGRLIEAEAIFLHVAAMTSEPSVLYWLAGTINLMHALRRWREEGTEATGYFTMDAGPNVHIIAERKSLSALLRKLEAVDGVQDVLVCGVGREARLLALPTN